MGVWGYGDLGVRVDNLSPSDCEVKFVDVDYYVLGLKHIVVDSPIRHTKRLTSAVDVCSGELDAAFLHIC